MRLQELAPAWYHWMGGDVPIGVQFDCPVHRGTPAAHRCFVPFANPIGDAQPEARRHLWQRVGDTFEILTLTPSVNYQVFDTGEPRDASCWHGFITNGEVT